jgi:hypothetical protein
MTIDRIKFHNLQRLDKVDADALQQQVYDYIHKEMTSGILGSSSGKVSVDNITFVKIIANDTFSLGQFDFVSDGKFCECVAGLTVDSSAITTNLQNYYDANSTLTGADDWYIWAKPEDSDTDLESREFWSTINNNTENNNVLTRVKTSGVVAISRVIPASGVGWTRVGKFVYTVAADIVSPSSIQAVPWTDSLTFGLSSIDTAGTSGLQIYTYAMEEALRKVMSDGLIDLSGTPSKNPGDKPTRSLEGLNKFVEEQTYSKRGHIILQFAANPNWPDGQEVDTSSLTLEAPYSDPTVVNASLLGFEDLVVMHTYDRARFAFPLNAAYQTNLGNTYNLYTNDLQDVNMFISYPNNSVGPSDFPGTPIDSYPRGDSFSPLRWITMFGNNGPWVTINPGAGLGWPSTVGSTNVVGLTAIGIFTQLTRPATAGGNNGTPNHARVVQHYIDYGMSPNRYGVPPTFKLHIIVKG